MVKDMPDALDIFNALGTVDIKSIAVQNVEDSLDVIADLQATQLSKGEGPTGARIDRLKKSYPYPVYHEITELYKSTEGVGLGSVTDRVTLYDTGEHYRKMYAQMKGEEMEIGSRAAISAKLERDYGEIYGLNEESREELITGVLNGKFQKEYSSQTGLIFS